MISSVHSSRWVLFIQLKLVAVEILIKLRMSASGNYLLFFGREDAFLMSLCL